jgi:P4 family phage/plasmid primase-like protien
MMATIIKQKAITLNSFLKQHTIKKASGESTKESTNTRIGDEEFGIFGGNYNIPEDEYPEFLNLVYREVFVKENPEYLTEAQLEIGPLLVDVDMRHNLSIQTRQYTEENIQELIEAYLVIFKEIFQFENEATIQFYFFEKKTVNPVPKKGYTKDGMHFIISLHCDRVTQQLIRKKIISSMDNTWNKDEMKLTNDWESMFDSGISTGKTNWQLIGCRKPNHEPYELTQIYTATFDNSDGEFGLVLEDLLSFNMKEDICKLSARYTGHYQPFMSNKFTEEYNAFLSSSSSKRGTNTNMNPHTNNIQRTHLQFDMNNTISNTLSITNREQLNQYLEIYVDYVSKTVGNYYDCYEAYQYVMTLPPCYYEDGSYEKWFKVCCALRNTSDCLFIVFVAFSAQASNFDFNISKLFERWKNVDIRDEKDDNKKCLTLRSIIYWSKKDAFEKYTTIREQSLDYYIEQSIDSGLTNCIIYDKKSVGISDHDIAIVLHVLKKHQFICASIKHNQWYEFKNHRWIPDDSGCSLDRTIPKELRALYEKKLIDLSISIAALKEDDEAKKKILQNRLSKVKEIYTKLGNTNGSKNIMTESKKLFYEKKMIEEIDTKEYLLCCSNGVWDFKEKVFREGNPEDYISKSTNIEYIELGAEHANIVAQINDFMSKLFPIEELREYMWNHLASILIGKAVVQTFNCYLGGGRNGKSVLVSLMAKVLGEYKGEITSAAITQKRTKVGGTSSEIAILKGVRYAVMTELEKGERINEGILKEYTGGDTVQARNLYQSTPERFTPQFKLVLMTNHLPEITAQDHGTWRRIRVVPFMSLFTENPVQNDPYKPYQFALDAKIDEKFDTWKTVFLSMLIQRVLKTGGNVPDCETVTKASDEYKHKQDVISQFIDEKIERSKGAPILKKSSVNAEFTIWHQSNYGTKGPQTKEVHDCLDRMFGPHEKAGWKDLKLVYDNDCDDSINEDDIDDPF